MRSLALQSNKHFFVRARRENTVADIMGGYHRTAAVETFTASKTDRHPTQLAALRGKRLVTAIETEEGRHWAEARIKQLTGGDKVDARFMRQDFFNYVPQLKLLVAGNHKPSLRTVDETIRRRKAGAQEPWARLLLG
jgi:putative DNA primase/helicase